MSNAAKLIELGKLIRLAQERWPEWMPQTGLSLTDVFPPRPVTDDNEEERKDDK